jgi:hypothetical protein
LLIEHCKEVSRVPCSGFHIAESELPCELG